MVAVLGSVLAEAAAAGDATAARILSNAIAKALAAAPERVVVPSGSGGPTRASSAEED
jgi:N-acetylglucosamine kinase-like BadF-type ATPase